MSLTERDWERIVLSDAEPRTVPTVALMTAPRYECVFARNMIERALQGAGVTLRVSGGVFYGHLMQRMLEQAIDDGKQLAVTVDFDSIFTASDLRLLMSRCVYNDDIDALASLQCRRNSPYPLLWKGARDEDTHIVFDGEPLRVRAAHFGLTCIKLDRLADVPKPWFWSTPDEDGGWEDGRVDDDVYFWHNWEKAGRSLYVDPQVSIGHLEEVVTRFVVDGNRLRHTHQSPTEWYSEHIEEHTEEAPSEDAGVCGAECHA